MSETIQVPSFPIESEDADWWYYNREEHDGIMAKGMEEGHALTMKQFLQKHGLEEPRVSVQLNFNDMVQARKQAGDRGMDTDAYIRGLLHEALMKSDAA